MLFPLLFAVGCSSPQPEEPFAVREQKEKTAEAQANTITEALIVFNMDRGNYPSNLKELTQKGPKGEKAILKPKAILDPWGVEFQFDPQGKHNDCNKPDVWTTSPYGKTIGNW
jgi:hypothetical protein